MAIICRQQDPVVIETRMEFEIVSVVVVCAREDGPGDFSTDESARASPKKPRTWVFHWFMDAAIPQFGYESLRRSQ
jgi:hypothetical protein